LINSYQILEIIYINLVMSDNILYAINDIFFRKYNLENIKFIFKSFLNILLVILLVLSFFYFINRLSYYQRDYF
jgi:hypothetical protein